MKKTSRFSISTLLAGLAILLSITATGQRTGTPIPTPVPARSFTHCSTEQDDCYTNSAVISMNFELNILNLPGGYDYRVAIKLYRGVLRGGFAPTMQEEVLFTTITSGAVTFGLIPHNVVTKLVTTDFIPLPAPLNLVIGDVSTAPNNGWYRAITTLQRYSSGTWVDVFSTTPSPAYGYNDATMEPIGDGAELARVKNLRRPTFDFSINGDYCNGSTMSEFYTCASKPLILQDIRDWLGKNLFEPTTLTVETNTGSGWSTLTPLTFTNNQNQNLNLTSLFGLSTFQGLLRVTYELAPDVCDETSVPVFKTKTFKVIPATFLNSYSAQMSTNICTPGRGKPICTTWNITTPMPAAGANTNDFKCNISNALGWAGATAVGLTNLTFSGNYTVDVYEVDPATGNRGSAPSIFLKNGTTPTTDYFSFNDGGYGASFDASNAPYYVDAVEVADGDGLGSGGNYFINYYQHACSTSAAALTAYSAKVFCAEVSQTTPAGCPVSLKSYFRIANNGACAGRFARTAAAGSEGELTPINVFPNPATDKVYLNWNNETAANGSKVQLRLMDVMGKVVLQQDSDQHDGHNKLSIDVSALAPGIYHYVLKTASGDFNGKLAKQ